MVISNAPASGAFFCIEGIEGSGKSTLIKSLQKDLISLNYNVCVTREPGGTSLGKAIRQILLNGKDTPISELSELLLFFADRAQHLDEVIQPALSSGQIVLSDRFVYSTISYQCFGRGLPRSHVNTLMNLISDNDSINILPKGVILIDLPVETGLSRARQRATLDRFENEEINFHERIRNGFLTLAKEDPDRFLVLDGNLDPASLSKIALKFISAKAGVRA